MKAVQIHKHGNVDVLNINDLEIPKCTDDKILVNIKACAINHLDIWVRNGLPGLPINLPLIMGSDGAGTIVEVGKNIDSPNRFFILGCLDKCPLIHPAGIKPNKYPNSGVSI